MAIRFVVDLCGAGAQQQALAPNERTRIGKEVAQRCVEAAVNTGYLMRADWQADWHNKAQAYSIVAGEIRRQFGLER